MTVSAWGLLGAVIGFAMGLLNYRVIIGVIEPRLRALDRSDTSEARNLFERKLVLLRRFVLGFELIVLTAAGYFAGSLIGGWIGGGGD